MSQIFLHCSVVSVSDIVRIIAMHASEWIPSLGAQPVSELVGNEMISPITMSISAPAVQALYLMHVNHVSAVAIVDKAQRLVANFSASDIKGDADVSALLPQSMWNSIGNFLVTQQHRMRAPVAVRATDTLEHVVLQMAMYRVHRVWIIDGDSKPIGVCTAFDVIKQFI